MRRLRVLAFAAVGLAALLLALGWALGPWVGSELLLHPWRRSDAPTTALAHEDVVLQGDGVLLRGWRFRTPRRRRGLVVYLHGISDDRRGGAGIAERFLPRGFDVLACDARAHGASGGNACTYGVLERRDLARVLDGELPPAGPAPVVLIGFSLGGAVALQAAAEDPRISLVVAVEPYSDLRTIARERAPSFVSDALVDAALARAGQGAGFQVDDASPLAAAPAIRCRVVLVHGTGDVDTPPEHSRRIAAALRVPGVLWLVPKGHNEPLDEATWRGIEREVDLVAPPSGDEAARER